MSLTTTVCDARKLPQQSPAPPASPAAGQSAQEEAASAAVVQAGAVSPSEHDGQRRHGDATVQRCRVQRCEEVPQETGWCAAHQGRAEILRVGALLGYPVLSYAPEHTTVPG